jgi:hypothetical protein
MSFIDLMQNDIWSNTDIDNKVQALIRSKYSQQDELKASRLARTANATEEEISFVAAVDTWVAACVQEGRDARKDMKVLLEVLAMLDANSRLLQPEVLPIYDEELQVTNEDEILEDIAQRQKAQETLDEASDEAKSLFEIRKPEVVEKDITDEVFVDIQ